MGHQRILGPRISIVVPALDAVTNVYFVLRQLPDADEVILVDGGSVDGTIDAARQARPDVRVLHRPGVSRAAALAEGFARASGDVIVTLPIDGSADPEEIGAFVAALVGGADVAKGSRFVGSGRHRSLGDRALSWLGRRLLGTDLSDLGHGFYGFWADQRELLALTGDGTWVEHVDVTVAGQFARAGARIVEVPSRRMAPLFGNDDLHSATSWALSVRAVFAEYRRSRTRSVPALAAEVGGIDTERSLA
jgi:glycosyltransferase involved in cell wall biosynthesis